MLLEEANAKYTMLSAAKHWGPKRKQDIDAAPVGLYTKAELNSLVQKQVSATVKQFQSKTSNKNNDSTKENNPNNKCHIGDKRHHRFPSGHGKHSLLTWYIQNKSCQWKKLALLPTLWFSVAFFWHCQPQGPVYTSTLRLFCHSISHCSHYHEQCAHDQPPVCGDVMFGEE